MKFILNEYFVLNEEETVKTWAEKYDACKTQEQFDSFWDSWYKETFENFAQDMRKFHAALEVSCKKLGWTGLENPTINWLIKLAENKEFGQKILNSLSPLSLDTIIEAHEKGYLPNFDKTLIDPKYLGKFNLIYNPEFYSLSSKVQLEWLQLQKAVWAQYKNDAQNGEIFSHVYAIGGSIEQASAAAKEGKTIQAPANLKMVEIAQGKQRAEKLLGKSFSNKEQADVTQILKKQITSPELAKMVLVYAYDIFTILVPGCFDALKETKPKIETFRKNSKGLTFDQTVTARKILQIPTKDYDSKRAAALLNGLAEKAGL